MSYSAPNAESARALAPSNDQFYRPGDWDKEGGWAAVWAHTYRRPQLCDATSGRDVRGAPRQQGGSRFNSPTLHHYIQFRCSARRLPSVPPSMSLLRAGLRKSTAAGECVSRCSALCRHAPCSGQSGSAPDPSTLYAGARLHTTRVRPLHGGAGSPINTYEWTDKAECVADTYKAKKKKDKGHAVLRGPTRPSAVAFRDDDDMIPIPARHSLCPIPYPPCV